MKKALSLFLVLVMVISLLPVISRAHAEERLTLDSVAWEDLSYRDIFVTNNKAYLDGFSNRTYTPFVPNAGIAAVTKEACYTGPYSLAAFGSPSQQIKSINSLPVGEYFVASKVYCTRYAAGELGVCLYNTTVGITGVTDGFVTAAGIISLSVSGKIYIGSIHSADLDGYVDDTAVIDMSIFDKRPSEAELTALYEQYVEMEKAIEREEVPYTEQEMLEAFVAYMNEKAAAIGMVDSRFSDPIGMDNITTALDLVRLMVYAYNNYPELNAVWGKDVYTVTVSGSNTRQQTVKSTVIKPALEDYYHILGGKTGTLCKLNARNLAVVLEIPESEDKLAVVALYANGLDTDETNRFAAVRQIADAAIAKYTDPNADCSGVGVCCAGAVACLIPADGVDINDLEILYKKDADTQRVPASITKVLSVICALDIVPDVAQQMTYSSFDTQIGSYYTGDFLPGDSLTLKDALYAMLLPSSNVTARMVAREVGAIILNGTHTHEYTATIIAPNCTEQGYTTYTCSCGDSYVDDYVDALGHTYENGACTVCGEYYVNFQSASISLAGNIAINFYVELGQPILDDESAYMSFTLPDGTTKTAMLSDAEVSVKNGVTRYAFTCEVHAKQMADMVVAQMHLGDGTAVGDSKSYSVVTYAGYIIAHEDQYSAYPSLVNLLKTMLNYGAYSQIHFGYNVNGPANAGLNLTLNDVTLGEVEAYRVKRAGGVTGLNIASVTLILRSETVLRFYYNLSEGYNIQDYNFVVKGQTVRPQYNESNGRYYVEVANIAAKDLDREYGVTVTNKDGTEAFSVVASVMSYVYQVIANPTYFTQDLKDVVKAMYAYNIAANAYFK